MRRRVVGAAILLALLTLIPAAAMAATNWALGADLGYSVFMPSKDYVGADNITTVGWPAGGGVIEAGIPANGGLRLSFTGEKPTHEVYLSTNLAYLSVADGGSFHQLQATLNYQYTFEVQGAVRPYLTLGAGLDRAAFNPHDGSGISVVSALFGGGFGVAHTLGHGVGRLRAEVRYDQQTEGEKDGDILLGKGGSLGLRLGFDLWGKKL